MATEKISAMPTATSANDADLIPIVQGGVNKKISVIDLLSHLFVGFPDGAVLLVTGGYITADPQITSPGGGELAMHTLVFNTQLVAASLGELSSANGVITALELHAANGFNGAGVFTNFTIVDGVITAAS